MSPDIIVFDELRGREALMLFDEVASGVQFIATMQSNSSGFETIRKLSSKPLKVRMQDMNELDVEVHFNKTSDGEHTAEVIEYKWLSRAEILENGTRVGSDLLRIEKTVENHATTPAFLNGSKVIDAYAKLEGLSYNYALMELHKRSDFLKGVCSDSKTTLEIVERIYRYALVRLIN
jgi:hypothetical protein